jgi:hypothetical protein
LFGWLIVMGTGRRERRAKEMQVGEASAVVPLSLEETWDLFLGDQLQHLVEAVENVNTAAWCRARGVADALDVVLIIGGAATGETEHRSASPQARSSAP